MARRKKVTTPTMVAAEGHGGCCEETVIGRSGDGDDLLRRERDASDSDLENDDMEERLIVLVAGQFSFETVTVRENCYSFAEENLQTCDTFSTSCPFTHSCNVYKFY